MKSNVEQILGPPQVLIIDDNTHRLSFLATLLRKQGIETETSFSRDLKKNRLRATLYHCIFADLDALERLDIGLLDLADEQEQFPPVIVLAQRNDQRSENFFEHNGVFDLLAHESQPAAVIAATLRALNHHAFRIENERLRQHLRVATARQKRDFDQGSLDENLRNEIATAAGNQDTVTIEGDIGTGMLSVAKTIHAKSGKSAESFLHLDCLGLTDTKIEIELFGSCEKSKSKNTFGLLHAARGGSLFLNHADHIGHNCQSRILKPICDSGMVTESDGEEPTCPRMILGVETELAELCESGKLAYALFEVLSKMVVKLPSLCERKRDLANIINSILEKQRTRTQRDLTIAADALEALNSYTWPGNEQEVEDTLREAADLTYEGVITKSCLPFQISHPVELSFSPDRETSTQTRAKDIELLSLFSTRSEASYIHSVVKHFGGNKQRAASALGISVTTLYRKLREARYDNSPTTRLL